MRSFKFGLAALCVVVVASGPTTSLACSLPSEVTLKQSFLSYKYPKAMYVTGATWSLRKAGQLAMPDGKRIVATGTERAEMDEVARLAALESLVILGDGLEANSHQEHSISIVLVERMHQERIMPRGQLAYDPLASDPKDDLILVTTEPVLHAITLGQLTIAQAQSHGALRLYGTDVQLAAFSADFDKIGAQPLTTESRHMSMINEGFVPLTD